MFDQVPVDSEPITMRAPCKYGCGTTLGTVRRVNGQDTVYCSTCGRHQYNAPRHELGLAPEPVRSETKPKLRYAVMEQAGFRCEFCGADSTSGRTMHLGHLLSEESIRNNGLPLKFADDPDNLVCLCDVCNLGMGKQSLTIHEALRFFIKRKMSEA